MMVNLARMILYIPEGVPFEFVSPTSFTQRLLITWEGEKLIVGPGFEVRVDPSMAKGTKAISIYDARSEPELPTYTRTTDRVHPYSPVVPADPWGTTPYPGIISPFDTICTGTCSSSDPERGEMVNYFPVN